MPSLFALVALVFECLSSCLVDGSIYFASNKCSALQLSEHGSGFNDRSSGLDSHFSSSLFVLRVLFSNSAAAAALLSLRTLLCSRFH